jgi:hypothetical protein
MSKAQLPLLTSIMMVVQAFLAAPAGLRAKRSIADRNQVRPREWRRRMRGLGAGAAARAAPTGARPTTLAALVI